VTSQKKGAVSLCDVTKYAFTNAATTTINQSVTSTFVRLSVHGALLSKKKMDLTIKERTDVFLLPPPPTSLSNPYFCLAFE